MAAPEIHIKKLNKKHTMNVTITSEFKIRALIAAALIRAAAWVLNSSIEIKEK